MGNSLSSVSLSGLSAFTTDSIATNIASAKADIIVHTPLQPATLTFATRTDIRPDPNITNSSNKHGGTIDPRNLQQSTFPLQNNTMIASPQLEPAAAPTEAPTTQSRQSRSPRSHVSSSLLPLESSNPSSSSPISSLTRSPNPAVIIPSMRDPVISIATASSSSSSGAIDPESATTLIAPAPQTPRSSTFFSSASAEAASVSTPAPLSAQSSVLPPPTTWIAFRSTHNTSPTSNGRRTATVKRHSSLRLCSTPPPESSLSDNETSSTSPTGDRAKGKTRPPLRRANSVTLGRRPRPDMYRESAQSTPVTAQASASGQIASQSLGGAKPLHPAVPKPYLAPLTCRGGTVESPYFRFEIHLLHQLYHMGYIEEQVVRHVELLLSTTRPGAMHANLRAAFEWYQGHVSRNSEQMMELAHRVRTFASYNIYFCKLMSWNDMWIEVSSHMNEVTSQVTKNYRYNPNGKLPAFPLATGDEATLQHDDEGYDLDFNRAHAVN